MIFAVLVTVAFAWFRFWLMIAYLTDRDGPPAVGMAFGGAIAAVLLGLALEVNVGENFGANPRPAALTEAVE